jgi:protein-tyrosine phosphatase
MSHKVSVLFVCMGNICRSPTAHGVFRNLLRQQGLEDLIYIDSAGTHAYHVGNPPDERSVATAEKRGIEMRDLRARKVDFSDFIEFDYILPMDDDNYANLMNLAPRDLQQKVRYFLEFAEDIEQKYVPDPYYGGPQGFENVFDLVEKASIGLLADIRNRHGI